MDASSVPCPADARSNAFNSASVTGSSPSWPAGANSRSRGLITSFCNVCSAGAAALLMVVTTPSSREYRADFDGALLAGDPMALASALRKISASAADLPLPARGLVGAAGHLMIAHPFAAGGLGRLFLTHPPVVERVRRLESLAGDPRLPALPATAAVTGCWCGHR